MRSPPLSRHTALRQEAAKVGDGYLWKGQIETLGHMSTNCSVSESLHKHRGVECQTPSPSRPGRTSAGQLIVPTPYLIKHFRLSANHPRAILVSPLYIVKLICELQSSPKARPDSQAEIESEGGLVFDTHIAAIERDVRPIIWCRIRYLF